MKCPGTSLRRMVSTVLPASLAFGLGLIAPASSAWAEGVERGGLIFTIVSDDIGKTAHGSVPQVDANSSSASSGDGSAEPTDTSGSADASTSGSTGDPNGSTGDPGTGDTAADTTADTTTDSGGGTESDASTYDSAAELNQKSKTNSSKGKGAGQR